MFRLIFDLIVMIACIASMAHSIFEAAKYYKYCVDMEYRIKKIEEILKQCQIRKSHREEDHT